MTRRLEKIVPCRVRVRESPWTRPPMMHRHPIDLRLNLDARRVGTAHGVNHLGHVEVRWDPPAFMAAAPPMTNHWPADQLEFA